MTPTSTTLPFLIGRTYDAEMASDGESRYGHYVREAVTTDRYPWDLDDDADRRHEFAALAWRAATPPVMAPGYVRYHHLISDARVYRSSWDGTLAASVSVLTPPPATLAQLRGWQSWQIELRDGNHVPIEPSEREIVRRSPHITGYALTTTVLEFALHDVVLPEIPAAPASPAVARTAAVAVGALVGALNDIVTPVIDAL